MIILPKQLSSSLVVKNARSSTAAFFANSQNESVSSMCSMPSGWL